MLKLTAALAKTPDDLKVWTDEGKPNYVRSGGQKSNSTIPKTFRIGKMSILGRVLGKGLLSKFLLGETDSKRGGNGNASR